MSGASPDGLIGEAGLIEVKCPITATHIDTLLGQAIPGRYVTQMQWQLAVSGRRWCDFVSYDPRLPADLRLFTRRVHRDDALIAALEREVTTFLAEVSDTLAELARLAPQSEAA
jgi:predicted phage-related endonuclease